LHKLDLFLPDGTRKGKPLKYDRDWLLNVSIFFIVIKPKVANTLKQAEFERFRKDALTVRQKKHVMMHQEEVKTISEIAEHLKQTQLFSSKYLFHDVDNEHLDVVHKGRAASLLRGIGSKKRKLNEGQAQNQSDFFRQEIESLRQENT